MTTTPADAIFEALWAKVVEDFSDMDRHNKLLDHARSSGTLDGLAARYREHEEESDDPEVEKMVAKRLNAITLVALSELDATRGTSKDFTRLRTGLKIAAFVLFMGAMLGLLKALLS